MKIRVAAITLSLFTSLAGTASAGTFLQVFETNSSVLEYVLTNNGGTGNTLAVTNGAVNYDFSVPNGLGTGIRPGILNFTATTSVPVTSGVGNLGSNGWSGSGSVFDTLSGTVAFSWAFGPTGSILVGAGGTGGAFADSRPPASEVSMSSPYLNFNTSTSESFGTGLSGASPVWAIGAGGYFADSTASGVTTFDAEPLPTGSPEPATAFLMGSALIGVALVSRKRLAR